MRKSDYILIAVLLAASLLGFLYFKSGSTNNKILIIRQDNAIVKRISLREVPAETKLELKVPDGTLEVHYDKTGAWVVESPCPDKVCMHQGKATKPGETVACVPEKVLLIIEAKEKEGEHDAILR